MKHMLLVHRGTTSAQPSEERERLSGDETSAVGAAGQAINETPSHHPSFLRGLRHGNDNARTRRYATDHR